MSPVVMEWIGIPLLTLSIDHPNDFPKLTLDMGDKADKVIGTREVVATELKVWPDRLGLTG